jgi:dTDP-4-dehydrorhamnose 3,5-epimerase
MNRFEIFTTSLAGLRILRRKSIVDSRGFLERLFCAEDLRGLIGDATIVQVNHTLTVKRGTVRGLHFQRPPYAETKFVSCLRGQVFDVAVDLRSGSPTFLKWHAELLSRENHTTLVIPEGFAHGFQALSADCELLYFHTVAYRPESEGAINALDPLVGIKWPEEISEISTRDKSHSMLSGAFTGIAL